MINQTETFEDHIIRDLIYNEKILINYDAVYPKLADSDNQQTQKINTIIAHLNDRKIDYLKSVILPSAIKEYEQCRDKGFIPFDYYSRPTISYQGSNLFSFYIDSALNMHKHGSIYKKESITFNLNSGDLLRLEDFFIKNSRFKEIILSSIAEQLQNRIKSGCTSYYDEWHIKMLEYFNLRNYYLTKEGFCIYYEPYTLADGELGYITFEIAFDLLINILLFEIG